MSAIAIVSHLLSRAPAVKAFTKHHYPIEAPQSAKPPFTVLNIVSGKDEHMLSGAGRYPLHRIAVDCVALTGQEACDIGDAVLAALEDVIKLRTLDFVDIDISFADVDMTQSSSNRSSFMRTLHFMVRWRRA